MGYIIMWLDWGTLRTVWVVDFGLRVGFGHWAVGCALKVCRLWREGQGLGFGLEGLEFGVLP